MSVSEFSARLHLGGARLYAALRRNKIHHPAAFTAQPIAHRVRLLQAVAACFVTAADIARDQASMR